MAGQLTIDTLKASTGVLATQNGMTGISKAWVYFNGSTAAINGSFNVSSITKNSTGNYTVNFTTAMANTNYSTVVSSRTSAGNGVVIALPAYDGVNTTSAIQVLTNSSTFSAIDGLYTNVAVFGA
jgi:hypothetical protein